MKLIQQFAIGLFALFIAADPSIANSLGTSSTDDLLKNYKTAQAKHDVPGMMALVLFQSANEQQRNSWKKDFQVEVEAKVVAKIVPLTEYAVMLSPEALKRIRSSIKLVNWLVIELPPEDESTQRSHLYPIGMENGKFFIVGP